MSEQALDDFIFEACGKHNVFATSLCLDGEFYV